MSTKKLQIVGNLIDVDSEISATSTNPVQNQAIAKAIEETKKYADDKIAEVEISGGVSVVSAKVTEIN